jgi:DNA polymerase-3 subunit beta
MPITLSPELLKAAVLFTSKEETRFYLKGVSIQATPATVKVASTDGHRLFVARVCQEENTDTFSIIIPTDTIATATKGVKYGYLDLSKLSDTQWRLGDTIFTPIDGSFPEYSRVVPTGVSGEAAQYNPEYVASLGKANKLLGGTAENTTIGYNGDKPALVTGSGFKAHNALAVLMPLRFAAEDWNFILTAAMGDGFATPPAEAQALAA